MPSSPSNPIPVEPPSTDPLIISLWNMKPGHLCRCSDKQDQIMYKAGYVAALAHVRRVILQQLGGVNNGAYPEQGRL